MAPRLNVLLVENLIDDYQLFVLCLQLLDLPHDVGRGNTQTELFSLIYPKTKYDLIVIDIREQDWAEGIAFLLRIKTHAILGKIPVVVFGKKKNQENIDQIYELGAHFYAIKPYFQPNYMQMVRRIFLVEWSKVPERPTRENFVINLAFA